MRASVLGMVLLALAALFSAGEGAAKEAEVSSKESYQQAYCDKLEMAQDMVDVETLFEDMEASPYKGSIREFWTTSACRAPLKNDTPVPIIFNTSIDPVRMDGFPKVVHDYFVEDHQAPETWLKAINTTTSDGYTFLDFMRYNIQRGFRSGLAISDSPLSGSLAQPKP